jgi:ABC-2 type transport system permease protein
VVVDLIRLKLAIQRHTLSWKRLLGLALGSVAAVATWAAVLLAGTDGRGDVLTLLLAVWLVGWLVGPILTSGAAVLRPEYFTLLPLPRRTLVFGLLAAVFVGVGAAVTTAAVLALVGHALLVASGPALVGAIGTALLGAAALLVFVVALSRTVYALLGAAMRTRAGIEIAAVQYGLLFASMFAGWMVVSPLVTAVPVFLRDGLAGSPAGAVLAWSPVGWPVRAVDAVAAGEHVRALGLLGALVLAAALAVLAAVALLTPHVGNRTARRRSRPLGSRVLRRGRLLPASPLGAVVGKELRTWWRDPWRSLEVRSAIWFGLFLAAYGVLAGRPEIAGLAGIAVALMAALSGANLYGQDGTALWQLVVAERPEAVRADIRGRQVGLALVLGVPAVVLSALMMVLTGVFAYAVPIAAVLVATLGSGSGIAVVMSVVGATPGVDPHRRAVATDAGENTFAIMVAFYATTLAILPTAALAAPLAFAGGLPQWWPAATLAVALVNAAAVAWAGGAVAARRLGTHLPETFARLRYPGTAMAGRGTGLLDRLSAQAEKTAMEAAAAAKGRNAPERTEETVR